MRLYKLTDENYETKNHTKWEIGKTNSLPECENPELCSKEVFYAYKHLNLGILLNPIHVSYSPFKVFLCEGKIEVEVWDKIGTFELTPIEEIEIPSWYKNEGVRKKVQIQFAVLCTEKTFPFYEKIIPGDSIRMEKAIEVAKNYLKNPINENVKVAYDDSYAAYDAANAADRAIGIVNWINRAAKRTEIDLCELADQAVEMTLNLNEG